MSVNFAEKAKTYSHVATIIGVAVSIIAVAAMIFFENEKLDRSKEESVAIAPALPIQGPHTPDGATRPDNQYEIPKTPQHPPSLEANKTPPPSPAVETDRAPTLASTSQVPHPTTGPLQVERQVPLKKSAVFCGNLHVSVDGIDLDWKGNPDRTINLSWTGAATGRALLKTGYELRPTTTCRVGLIRTGAILNKPFALLGEGH